MDILNQTLLRWPPRRTKTVAESYQRSIFGHQSILELWASIASKKRWQGAASHDAVSEHPSHLCGFQPRAWLYKNPMAQATDVGHRVTVALLVHWVAGPFEVYHHFFPTVSIRRDDGNCFLFLRHLAEPKARDATVPPLVHIAFHVWPPDLALQKSTRFICVAMRSQDADMAL